MRNVQLGETLKQIWRLSRWKIAVKSFARKAFSVEQLRVHYSAFTHFPLVLVQSRNVLLMTWNILLSGALKAFYSYYRHNERKKDPHLFYRSTVREPLSPLFLVWDGKGRETSERILPLEILKEICSLLCKIIANILHIFGRKIKRREGKDVVKIGFSLKCSGNNLHGKQNGQIAVECVRVLNEGCEKSTQLLPGNGRNRWVPWGNWCFLHFCQPRHQEVEGCKRLMPRVLQLHWEWREDGQRGGCWCGGWT